MGLKDGLVSTERHGFEFGGPTGALGMTFGLPAITYLLIFACNDISGCPAPALLAIESFTMDKFWEDVGLNDWGMLFNLRTFIATLGYYALSFLLFRILPATEVYGTRLRNGGRIKYRFNAFTTFMTFLAILGLGTTLQGDRFFIWIFITDNYLALITSNLVIATLLATYFYVKSFSIAPGQPASPTLRELALGGDSGNMLYDWFIGRELNPSVWIPGIGHVDIKSFMETRPGLMGWMIINLAFVAKQHRIHGRVTNAMYIVVLSQAFYVLDSFWNEPAIMTQIDITTDGFGFMLAFGDLVWVPFTFTLHARYLSVYPNDLGAWTATSIVGIALLGYYIFRASNSQKDLFRTDPDHPSVKNLPFIQTQSGSRLLTGGWWGMARHVNYLGDWMLSCAYCMPTGFAGYIVRSSSGASLDNLLDSRASIPIEGPQNLQGEREVVPGAAQGWGMLITYFYLFYFAVLLVHRQRRDDEKCARKYGKDWQEYIRQNLHPSIVRREDHVFNPLSAFRRGDGSAATHISSSGNNSNSNEWKEAIAGEIQGSVSRQRNTCAARLGLSTLILACRNAEKGEAAISIIRKETGCGADTTISVWQVDLSSYKSVISFCKRINAELPRLDGIIENAGVEMTKFELAEDLELSLVVNDISTLLMAVGVLPKLKETAERFSTQANLTLVGSCMHAFADDSQFDIFQDQNIFQALSDAKTANMPDRYQLSKLIEHLCFNELAKQIDGDGVVANIVNPGWCATELNRHKDEPLVQRLAFKGIGWTSEKGSRVLVQGVTAGMETNGKYLAESQVKRQSLFVLSERGQEVQRRVWLEMMGLLKEISPELADGL